MSTAIEVFRDEQRLGFHSIQTTTIVARPVSKSPEMSVYTYTRSINNNYSSKQYTAVGPTGLTTVAELLELFLHTEGVIRERLLSL